MASPRLGMRRAKAVQQAQIKWHSVRVPSAARRILRAVLIARYAGPRWRLHHRKGARNVRQLSFAHGNNAKGWSWISGNEGLSGLGFTASLKRHLCTP